jgi:hypothetical protein
MEYIEKQLMKVGSIKKKGASYSLESQPKKKEK